MNTEIYINNRDEFIQFINVLIEDFRINGSLWGNSDLLSFLEAMAAWVEDMDGYYAYKNQALSSNISWNIMADILSAAKIYE